MCDQGYSLTVVVLENVLQQFLGPDGMFFDGFPTLRLPQLVLLYEAFFNLKAWVSTGDPRFVAPLVARVNTKSFAQPLLDDWLDSRFGFDTWRERELRGAQTSTQWACIDGLRERYVL